MSVIQEVARIPGYDPRVVTYENAYLSCYYLPRLQQAYADLAGELTLRRDNITKVAIPRAEYNERLRLLELRSAGTGPGGTKLDVDTIKFLSKRCPEVLGLTEAANSLTQQINQLWSYHKALCEASVIAITYHGRMRAETSFGFHANRISHGFEPPTLGAAPPVLGPETGEVYELPEIQESEE